jgi:uncharacterized protein YegP (UPF0339 family)
MTDQDDRYITEASREAAKRQKAAEKEAVRAAEQAAKAAVEGLALGADYTVSVYEAKDGWRWRVKASNGNVVADSGEAYENRVDCEDIAHALFDRNPSVAYLS